MVHLCSHRSTPRPDRSRRPAASTRGGCPHIRPPISAGLAEDNARAIPNAVTGHHLRELRGGWHHEGKRTLRVERSLMRSAKPLPGIWPRAQASRPLSKMAVFVVVGNTVQSSTRRSGSARCVPASQSPQDTADSRMSLTPLQNRLTLRGPADRPVASSPRPGH